jgi:hypothetical protein
MQKKLAGILSILLLLLYALPLRAQNTQPQSSYSAQISAANPALNLTFNNLVSPFRENTTGVNFIAPTVSYTGLIAGSNITLAAAETAGAVYLNQTAASQSCTVGAVTVQFFVAPTAGTVVPIVLASGSAGSYSVTSPATFTTASTTALQTFTVGAGLSSTFAMSSANLVGVWGATGAAMPGRASGAGGSSYTLAAASTLPTGTNTYSTSSGPVSISVQCVSTNGTILSGQTGFDTSQPNQTAVSIPYNAYLYAPNDTLGDVEWNTPWWFTLQVDRLNWGRSGTKLLVSKGNIGGGASATWWELYIHMFSATTAQYCLVLNGGASDLAKDTICSQAVDNPNGYNDNIFVAYDGIGSVHSPVLYVNGLGASDTYLDSGSANFGGVAIAVGGSGTGYQTATPFENIGGGSNCVVTGILNSTSGVPASVTTSATNNYGCTAVPTLAVAPYVVSLSGSGTGYATSTAFTSTGGGTGCAITGTMASSGGVPASVTVLTDTQACTSAPTIVLTAPTGTGATLTAVTTPGSGVTLTATATGNSLSTSSVAPLYIAGAWSAVGSSSVWSATAPMVGSDTNSSEPNILIDQFAMGVGTAAPQSLIQGVFYQSKFYQSLLNPVPAVPYKLIYSNDGCNDPDNLYALALTIAAQKIGYVSLAGVENTNATGGNETAMYRQMLDQAGLGHIPVSVPSVGGNIGLCASADLNTYNASTPQSSSAYISSATMYRTILAANPTTPVAIMSGGTLAGIYDLLNSGADSISSLTGAQLWQRNATNGGFVNAQGLAANTTYTTGMGNLSAQWATSQYVMANNCPGGVCTPWYWFGFTPQSSGPGILATRNSKDPLYLFALRYGSDIRPAYDSLPTANFMSSRFAGPVTVSVGGGTGYAAQTFGTITGCGPNFTGSIVMNAVSGVPTTITDLSGFTPVGSGCPGTATGLGVSLTAPTGTGATFTVTPNSSVCGTITVTSATNGSTSTASCTGQYFMSHSVTVDPSDTPILQPFINSLIDGPPNPAPRGAH